MNFWLIKSEPGTYSINDLEKEKTTRWDGVRNYQAKNYLKEMKKGDFALLYHSITEKSVVGICKIAKEAYPEPGNNPLNWVAVDIEFYKRFKNPVSLSDIKSTTELKDLILLKQQRLSVFPVKETEYNIIVEKGE